MICSDTATVRMAFPRLMSGAVWDLLVVEVRGAHLEVGIVNGNAVAGWSHENEQLPDGQHRSLYRLELFEVSAGALELQIDWEPEERVLHDGDRWLVKLTPAGTKEVHVLMNEAVSYERMRTNSGCYHADLRAGVPEPLDGNETAAGGAGGQAGDGGDAGSR